MRSVGQKIVALTITKAELIADIQYAQEMLYVIRLLESMGLKVYKPIVLESNNKEVLDLYNSQIVGRRTKYIDT